MRHKGMLRIAGSSYPAAWVMRRGRCSASGAATLSPIGAARGLSIDEEATARGPGRDCQLSIECWRKAAQFDRYSLADFKHTSVSRGYERG